MVTSGFLDTPEVAGAADGVAPILAALGSANVHLVSGCSERTEAGTREWRAARDFPDRARIEGANVHFCRRRSDMRAICEGLGISGFIDGAWTVFQHLLSLDEGCTRLWIFNPVPDEDERWRLGKSGEHAELVRKWEELDLEQSDCSG
jgi:hypothetical protein